MFNNKKATTKNLVLERQKIVFALQRSSSSSSWSFHSSFQNKLRIHFFGRREILITAPLNWILGPSKKRQLDFSTRIHIIIREILRALPTHMGDHTFLIIWLGQAVCGIWKVTWVGWKNGGRKGKGLGRWWDGWWRFLGSMEKRAREGGRAGPRYIFRKKEGKVTAMIEKNAKIPFKKVFVSFKKMSKLCLTWY